MTVGIVGLGRLPVGTTQIGLAAPRRSQAFSPFINWWKQADFNNLTTTDRGLLIDKACWESGGVVYASPYLDSNGDLITPATNVTHLSRIFLTIQKVDAFTPAGLNYSGEQFTVSWTGSANVILIGPAGTTPGVRQSTSPATFTLGTFDTAVAFNVSVDFLLTDINDPPKNIKVYQTRYASALAAGKTFNPDWFAVERQFRILRTMDWMSTNNCTITDFSQMADENFWSWGQPFNTTTANGSAGPKGGMHPQLICRLLNESGCDGHVCIPIQATDALVTSLATYFRDNTSRIIDFELSNETWNNTFDQYTYCNTQAAALFGGNGDKWWGYRAAGIMKLIRDIMGNRARWRGVLATQTVATSVTNNRLIGINYWRANVLSPANSLTVADLFDDIHVTSYFGDGVLGYKSNPVSAANPGVVTTDSGSISAAMTGTTVRMFINAGPVQLNNTNVTLTYVDATHYSIGVDTSGMGKILASSNHVTATVLPNAPTYSNGTAGVGATMTAGSNAALVVNGANPTTSQRVIVKNQATPAQNGIYTVTNAGSAGAAWVLTRATDFDQAAEMIAGSASSLDALIDSNSTMYVLASTISTVGTDAITFNSVTLTNFWVASDIFDLMDQSTALNISTPATYPTKYTYFNQQIAASYLTGGCSFGFNTSVSVATLAATVGAGCSFTASYTGGILTVTAIASGALAIGKALNGNGTSGAGYEVILSQLTGSAGGAGTYKINTKATATSGAMTLISGSWEAQKAIGTTNGLGLRQYEGNFNMVGVFYLTGNGGNAQFNEFMAQVTFSSEIAAVYNSAYAQYKALGGKFASKFVDAGQIGVSGPWAMQRWFPLTGNGNSIDDNPVSRSVLGANQI